MKTRVIYTQYWNDSFISELTPLEKLVFIYLLTNDKVNIIHLYECTDKQIRFDTGIDTPTLEKAKFKFQEAGKIFFKDGYVYLRNADKYESFIGEKNEKAKSDLFSRLRADIVAWYEEIKNTPIHTPMYTPSIGSRSQKSEIINQNTETKIQKTEYRNLQDVNDKDLFEKIAEKYQTTCAYVESRYEDLVIYCGSKNKTYSNYYLALLNFVKSDLAKSTSYQGARNVRPNIAFVNPE